MALIRAPNGELLRDLWPGGLGRAGTDHNSVDSLESWQLMPVAFEDLCDWAKPKIDLDAPKIISGGGKRTPYALLWSPHLFQDDRADEMHRVSFRVHGFISNFDIRPLGNWNKSPAGAKGAVQFLTLVGNEQSTAFDPQVQLINNLDRYIYEVLRGQNGLPPRRQNAINLRRRVFTKVPISDPHSVQGVPLSDADQASVHDIRHDWKVAHRLSLAMQRPDGSVKRATELVFKKGDFVEVLVYADILAYSKDSKPFVDIQYAPQEVVRLWSAADANERLRAAFAQAAATYVTPVRPKITSVNSAYGLDDSGEEDDEMPDLQ